MGAEDLNLGLHACIANVLPTEHPPPPHVSIFCVYPGVEPPGHMVTIMNSLRKQAQILTGLELFCQDATAAWCGVRHRIVGSVFPPWLFSRYYHAV